MINRTKILLLVVCFVPVIVTANPLNRIFCVPYSHCESLYDAYPYSAMYYYGVTASNPLVRILRFDVNRWPEHIHSFEAAMTLSKCNKIRQFFYPIVGVVELAMDITVRIGSYESTIYEFDPFIGFRWANWPWNDYITTSVLLGEGLSYATSIPALEMKNPLNDSKRLLNYMRIEVTLALPCYPRLQLVPIIHHRSGAYGLYGAGNTGSNDISLGIKYIFD